MTKFSDEITKEIIKLYSDGIPIKDCANIVGIARRTIYNWMEKGKKAKSGKYYNFHVDMMKARGLFVYYHMKKLNESNDWRCSRYLLEVTNPEHYVIQRKLKTENKQEVMPNMFDEELFNRILEEKKE